MYIGRLLFEIEKLSPPPPLSPLNLTQRSSGIWTHTPECDTVVTQSSTIPYPRRFPSTVYYVVYVCDYLSFITKKK